MGFETLRKVRVGDLDVAYREAGNGEPLVLIHGWPFSSITWRKVVPGLAGEARCIAPDLLGAGETLGDFARDHGIGAQTNLILGFMDALGLPSATLIGHDSGGTFAREAAVARPDRVARIVIADTEVPGHRPALVPTLQKLMRWTKRLVLFGRMTRSKGFARSKLGFGRLFSDVDAFDFDEFFDVTLAPIAASERLQQGTLKFALDFDFARVDALRDSYKALTLPKYVLWGEDDEVFPLEEAWRLRDMLPGPTRFDMIPRAGMLVHEEQPEAWVSAVRSFLKYPPIS